MALGDGKSTFLSSIEAKRTTFITNVMQAEDDMVTNLTSSMDPAQNATQRQLKWDKIFTEFKVVEEAAFDAIVTEIQTNGIVNTGITVQVTPATGTGSTTGTGTIS